MYHIQHISQSLRPLDKNSNKKGVVMIQREKGVIQLKHRDLNVEKTSMYALFPYNI